MKTSQQFIECLDCQELYVLAEKENRYVLRIPQSRKTVVYHSALACPECSGTLVVSSFAQLNQILKDRKDEIAHLKLLQGDLEYKIYTLQEEKKKPQPICLQCGKPVTPGKKGRVPDYCSNSCKQKAYRTRLARRL